jgi:Domain of unknown function (DUF4262)
MCGQNASTHDHLDMGCGSQAVGYAVLLHPRRESPRMRDTFEWPTPEGEADERLFHNVRNHGCHLVGIAADEHGPAYVFSIGLFLNYGQAELVIFGLATDDACAIINTVRDRAAAGQIYSAGDVCDDLLVDRKVCFVEVPLDAYRAYLGTAIWFYAKLPRPFPCLQIVWPDGDGRFPWETGYDVSLRRYQPVLRAFS